MFQAFITLILLSTGQPADSLKSEPVASEEACKAVLEHDLPIFQARLDKLYPATYEAKGECKPFVDNSI